MERVPVSPSQGRMKPMSVRQQNKLISLMRTYSPPGHPRSGVTIEYCEEFWKRAASALNEIESDPRQSRDKDKWRQVWRYYSTRVKKKINSNQKMTIFEEQVASVLQRNFLEELNINFEEDNNVELLEVQPDLNGTGPAVEAENAYRPARIQNKRRKTVGFVEQASIDQARTNMERSRMSHFYDQINANNEPIASTSRQDLAPYDESVLGNPVKFEIRSFDNEQMSFNRFNPSPSPSQASTMILEPPPSHQETPHIKTEPVASPSGPQPSTSEGYGNSSSNNVNGQVDEINRKLFEAKQMGQRLAKDLASYNLMINSISETFQQFSGQNQEVPSEINNSQNLSLNGTNGRRFQRQSETDSEIQIIETTNTTIDLTS